jgi:hypothetical protein
MQPTHISPEAVKAPDTSQVNAGVEQLTTSLILTKLTSQG